MTQELSYTAAFLGGLISFLSPCVLPLVPGYLCFVGGTSLDELTGEDSNKASLLRNRVMMAALFFVLGFSTVFIALGASASALNALIAPNLHILSPIAGVLIALFGLHYMHVLRIPFLDREARVQTENRPVSLIGGYVVGLAFGFGWTPCIGPILATILAIAAGRDSVSEGVVLLSVYSAGLGLPFLLSAYGMRHFMSFAKRFRGHTGTLEKVTGGLLVLTGVLISFGTLQSLSYWLIEYFPALAELG